MHCTLHCTLLYNCIRYADPALTPTFALKTFLLFVTLVCWAVLSDCLALHSITRKNDERTSRITMMLVHKILDCVQVAIGTGQREWSVTSLVGWFCGRPPSTT